MEWRHFYRCFIKNLATIMAQITKLARKNKVFMDKRKSKSLGACKTKIHLGTNINTTKLRRGVPCSHICIIVGYGCFTSI
jgi:hypothetical protein